MFVDMMNVMKVMDVMRWGHVWWMRSKRRRTNTVERIAGCVLIIAPHPDDEVIGCGGLIARMVAQGDVPYIAVMTGGEESHHGCCSLSAEQIRSARRSLTADALEILGVPRDHIFELSFRDGHIAAGGAAERAELQRVIAMVAPDVVLVPHRGEGWPDHLAAGDMVREVAPMVPVWEYCVWVWYYNVWRGLAWDRARYVRLTAAERARKRAAMAAYVTPTAPCGKPWSGVLPQVFLAANSGRSELFFSEQARN